MHFIALLMFMSLQDILGDIIVKNLDTGEQIPLSMADTHIPKGWNYNNPVDSYCQQTAGR